MRKIYTTIILMGLLFPLASMACDNSEFNLVNLQNLGNNQYEFTVEFCVGHGRDGNQYGADSYTHTWAVHVDNNAAIVSFPATLTSPATGTVFTGSNTIYGDTILIYDRPSATWEETWACIEVSCTPVMQACLTFTFITDGLPDNLVLMGAEGMGVGVPPYGCNGLDKMEIHLNAPTADAGADQSVVYGYGSSCVDLVGSASNGLAPYTYSWSNGATTSTVNVCPSSTTTYTLTFTDSNGNTSTDDVTVNVNDVTCGNNRVWVCHRGSRTKCVRVNRVQRHLNHGDQLGACPNNRLEYVEEPDIDHGLFIYPNPASNYAELKFVMDDDGFISAKIYSLEGRLVQTVTSAMEVKMDGLNYLDIYLDEYKSGVYTVVIESTSGERLLEKLNVMK